MAQNVIGIDIGGTKIIASMIDQHYNVLNKINDKTKVSEGHLAVVKQIIDMVSHLSNQPEIKTVDGVGLGVAGQINHKEGVVLGAPNLYWENIPLKEILLNELKLPVIIDNDVHMATYGEWKLGAGRGIDELVCIFVGTGIGGGIISNGKIVRGANNTAGEIGHMTVNQNGLTCKCGNKGCLEAYAGGWAIAQQAQRLIDKSKDIDLELSHRIKKNEGIVTAQIISEAAFNGSPTALKIFDDVIAVLAVGCASVINAIGPKRIILGGGVIEKNPHMIEKIESSAKNSALPPATGNVDIVKAELGNEAIAIGAATALFSILTQK